MVAVAYRRWSFTRGCNCKALTGKGWVFWIGGRLWEVVAHVRRRFACSLPHRHLKPSMQMVKKCVGRLPRQRRLLVFLINHGENHLRHFWRWKHSVTEFHWSVNDMWMVYHAVLTRILLVAHAKNFRIFYVKKSQPHPSGSECKFVSFTWTLCDFSFRLTFVSDFSEASGCRIVIRPQSTNNFQYHKAESTQGAWKKTFFIATKQPLNRKPWSVWKP